MRGPEQQPPPLTREEQREAVIIGYANSLKVPQEQLARALQTEQITQEKLREIAKSNGYDPAQLERRFIDQYYQQKINDGRGAKPNANATNGGDSRGKSNQGKGNGSKSNGGKKGGDQGRKGKKGTTTKSQANTSPIMDHNTSPPDLVRQPYQDTRTKANVPDKDAFFNERGPQDTLNEGANPYEEGAAIGG